MCYCLFYPLQLLVEAKIVNKMSFTVAKYKFRLKTLFRAECYPCIVLKAVGKNRKLKFPVDL